MAEKINKDRGLSRSFMNELKEGLLFPFLTLIKQDATLCLQIRENYINIYYRGGNLIKIRVKNPDKHIYKPHFDPNYAKDLDKKFIENLPPYFESGHDTQKWIDAIPLLKHTMDIWFGKHPKSEREFQQIVMRENNGETIGSSTDYFIIDIEYDNHEGARFDMVAIRWDSDRITRKLQGNFKPTLCLVETKFGDGALSGNAGILKHIDDFKCYANLQNIESIKQEMLNVFSQQRRLGLIPALKCNTNEIKEFSNGIDYLFILSNHNPASIILHDTLKEIKRKLDDGSALSFNLRFCVSNFMGYGIYKENIYSLDDFMNRFKRQILCD